MSTCIITGIGSGIGRAVVIELARRNYYDKYALIGRNQEAINNTIEEMKKNGAKGITCYSVDLSEPSCLQSVVKRIFDDLLP